MPTLCGTDQIGLRYKYVCTNLMKIHLKITFLVILLIEVSGCASVYTQSHDAYADTKVDCSDSKTIPNIYSGFIFDLYCISAENAGFFCLVDLPFSFITDSLVLPYTVYRQSKYGSWYQQSVCQVKNQ